jgi:hypothetical protein
MGEIAAAADALVWKTFADAMSAWLRKGLGVALALSEDAIALDPECANAWNGKGNVPLARQSPRLSKAAPAGLPSVLVRGAPNFPSSTESDFSNQTGITVLPHPWISEIPTNNPLQNSKVLGATGR